MKRKLRIQNSKNKSLMMLTSIYQLIMSIFFNFYKFIAVLSCYFKLLYFNYNNLSQIPSSILKAKVRSNLYSNGPLTPSTKPNLHYLSFGHKVHRTIIGQSSCREAYLQKINLFKTDNTVNNWSTYCKIRSLQDGLLN